MNTNHTIQSARLLSVNHRALLTAIAVLPILVIAVVGILSGHEPHAGGIHPPAGLYYLIIKTLTFAVGVTIAVLCFLQLAQTGQMVKAVLATPLLVGGVMALIQVLAVEGVLPHAMNRQAMIISSWHLSETMMIVFLCILSAIFLMTDSVKGKHQKHQAFLLITGLGAALTAIGLIVLYTVSNHPGLIANFSGPDAIFPIILGWISLGLVAVFGLFILPIYMLWQPSAFLQLMMLACIPLGLSHAIMALGPTTCCGWEFAAANTGIFIAFLLPAVGLILDYRWTYQATQQANQTLRNECFLANQLQETARYQEQRLHTLLHHTHQPVCFFDASLRLVKINPLGVKVGLMDPSSPAIGRSPADAFKPSLANLIMESGHEVLGGEDAVSVSDEWMMNGDQDAGPAYRWHFHAISDESGRSIGMMAIGEEVRAAALAGAR